MKKHELILANLKALKIKQGMSSSKIAEKANLPERSVSRFFSGESDDPGILLVGVIINTLGTTWADVAGETGDRSLAELLTDVEKMTVELERLQKENAELRELNTTLTVENDIQRRELKHKDELLAVHDYYLKRRSAHDAIKHKKPRRP